jgi:hypothetical protein
VPHPAARRLDVAVVPGNDVDVQVKDRLARGLADVHADVVAVGPVDALDGGPRVGDGGHQLRPFLVGGVEP